MAWTWTWHNLFMVVSGSTLVVSDVLGGMIAYGLGCCLVFSQDQTEWVFSLTVTSYWFFWILSCVRSHVFVWLWPMRAVPVMWFWTLTLRRLLFQLQNLRHYVFFFPCLGSTRIHFSYTFFDVSERRCLRFWLFGFPNFYIGWISSLSFFFGIQFLYERYSLIRL